MLQWGVAKSRTRLSDEIELNLLAIWSLTELFLALRHKNLNFRNSRYQVNGFS